MEARTGRFVAMGVSGVGKSRLGLVLAGAPGGRCGEGEDLRPPASRSPMAAGTPLAYGDRAPWLDRVGAALAGGGAPALLHRGSACPPRPARRQISITCVPTRASS